MDLMTPGEAWDPRETVETCAGCGAGYRWWPGYLEPTDRCPTCHRGFAIARSRWAIGRGWWPILDDAVTELTELDPDWRPERRTPFRRKLGTLRIDVVLAPWSEAWARGDFLIEDAALRIVREAAVLSSRVCEGCGAPGRLRGDPLWALTLCDACEAP